MTFDQAARSTLLAMGHIYAQICMYMHIDFRALATPAGFVSSYYSPALHPCSHIASKESWNLLKYSVQFVQGQPQVTDYTERCSLEIILFLRPGTISLNGCFFLVLSSPPSGLISQKNLFQAHLCLSLCTSTAHSGIQ